MGTTKKMTKRDVMKKLLELESDINEINGMDFISHDMRSGCIEIDMEGSTESEIEFLMELIRPIVLKNKKKRLEALKTDKILLENQLLELLT